MLPFRKNPSLTNSTTFWQHSQIQMALWWLRETSKESYWCFFSKEKYEIGNEMVFWRHFIIYATKLKNWILFFSHKKFSIFKIPTNLLFSLEKNFSLILLLLPSKLATSVCKTLQSVVWCFLKTCIHSNELISFDYFLNAPLFFHTKFIFPFHIKVIPMKFIQDKNLELPNGEFYSR